MKKMISLRLTIILALILSISANATIWYVHPDSLLNSIQAGIDSSSTGDTVLVAEGTYYENIKFKGKSIVVGSMFLTTVDTTYISSTIIDGDTSGIVVTFSNREDSTAVFTGFKIQNGNAIPLLGNGGGIHCSYSSPSLTNVTISGNRALYGGGIYCHRSNPSLTNVIISGNSAGNCGGGIYCYKSNPSLTNVTISGNEGEGIYCSKSSPNLTDVTISENSGSGFSCDDNSNPILTNVIISENDGSGFICNDKSNPILTNVTISGNTARFGGGIYCGNSSNLNLTNVTISGNTVFRNYGPFGVLLHSKGGGIYSCDNSSLSLNNVTISGNSSYFGGGIYCDSSSLSFDSVNRCNIFLNFAGLGSDLYAINCDTIDVIVDTFTVLQPDDNFAYPIDNFTFDILNGVEQVNQNLYVSPNGSDDNSGLTVNEPLMTISYALAKIISDSTNPHTIYLANGTYSPSETGERFPLNCRSYVSLHGESEETTILDAEESNNVLYCYNDNYFSIENMTIQNGLAPNGGGIYCYSSSPSLKKITISGNTAKNGTGGGIYYNNSSPSLTNVTISENEALGNLWFWDGEGGGIHCNNSSPSLTNVIISGNKAIGWAGYGGGIYCNNSSLSLVNVITSGNTTHIDSVTADGSGGGIYCSSSSLSLVNCILWNDTQNEISGHIDSVTATYSCIQGGWPGIGNLDEDPVFVSGPLSDYHLCPFTPSPCIDAGNPDAQYNDPEDPLIPGYAMWPALGTIRNDMGVYGGPGTEVWAGVEEEIYDEEVFTLSKAYPNPFMYKTQIEYNLSRISNINISVYNVLGAKVRTLLNKRQNTGRYTITWDGNDERGNKLPSGFYFLKLEVGEYKGTRKLLLVR